MGGTSIPFPAVATSFITAERDGAVSNATFTINLSQSFFFQKKLFSSLRFRTDQSLHKTNFALLMDQTIHLRKKVYWSKYSKISSRLCLLCSGSSLFSSHFPLFFSFSHFSSRLTKAFIMFIPFPVATIRTSAETWKQMWSLQKWKQIIPFHP